jgi:CelD/BcsL family acetyltransferase involved in cellulose biosynthesis
MRDDDAVDAAILPWRQFALEHAQEWQTLWEREQALVDTSPAWQQAVLTTHDVDPDQVFVVTARHRDGSLCLVFPFRRRQRLGPLRLGSIEPLHNVFSMYSEPLTSLAPGVAMATVYRALKAWDRRWHWLDLQNLVQGSDVSAAWRQAWAAEGQQSLERAGARSPFVRPGGTLETYLAGKSKRFRKTMTGLIHDATDNTQVRIDMYRTPAECEAFYRHMLTIESRSWKHEAGSAITARPLEQRFYPELLARLAPLGVLQGVVMWIEDQPAAYMLLLLHGRRVLGLKGSFDQQFAKLSPGKMLNAYMLGQMFSQGQEEYDFLGSDEEYKVQWATGFRARTHLRLYRRTVVGTLMRLADAWRQARKQRAAAAAEAAANAAAAAAATVPERIAEPRAAAAVAAAVVAGQA